MQQTQDLESCDITCVEEEICFSELEDKLNESGDIGNDVIVIKEGINEKDMISNVSIRVAHFLSQNGIESHKIL